MKFRVIVVGLIEKNNQYLLGKKPENIGPYPNTWHLPGGGIGLDEETLEEALRREMEEEAEIKIDKIEALGFDEDYEKDKHGEMTHYIFLDFKANYLSGEINANDDMKKLKWVEKNMLKKLNLNKPTKKLFKKLDLI
jgi:8-oxo-dGTP diphosphatase